MQLGARACQIWLNFRRLKDQGQKSSFIMFYRENQRIMIR